jgi:hypothetical protein
MSDAGMRFLANYCKTELLLYGWHPKAELRSELRLYGWHLKAELRLYGWHPTVIIRYQHQFFLCPPLRGGAGGWQGNEAIHELGPPGSST